MTLRPLDESQDPSKASDAQKIALYIANLLLKGSVLGNVNIATGDRPVTQDHFASFKDTTGLKIHDSGYGAADFLQGVQADAAYQRGARTVGAGTTRTVPAGASDTIAGPFTVENTGAVVVEDGAVLLVL